MLSKAPFSLYPAAFLECCLEFCIRTFQQPPPRIKGCRDYSSLLVFTHSPSGLRRCCCLAYSTSTPPLPPLSIEMNSVIFKHGALPMLLLSMLPVASCSSLLHSYVSRPDTLSKRTPKEATTSLTSDGVSYFQAPRLVYPYQQCLGVLVRKCDGWRWFEYEPTC